MIEARIEKIITIMRMIGYKVEPRPAPALLTHKKKGGNHYNVLEHAIYLEAHYEETTLWHELCHSQQVLDGLCIDYHLDDGRIHSARWFANPLEQQAMVIEALAPRPDQDIALIIAMVKAYGIDAQEEWRWLELAGLTDLELFRWLSLQGLEQAGIDPKDIDWINWVLKKDLGLPKPSKLGRRARLTINQHVRQS